MRKMRRNPEYRYYYYIGRPIQTIGGQDDIEVLSEHYDPEDNETYYKYARSFEGGWTELNFESIEEALDFLRKMKDEGVLNYGTGRYRPEYIVNQKITTDLYLYYLENDLVEVVGGEEVIANSPHTNHIKYVATIYYGKINE